MLVNIFAEFIITMICANFSQFFMCVFFCFKVLRWKKIEKDRTKENKQPFKLDTFPWFGILNPKTSGQLAKFPLQQLRGK